MIDIDKRLERLERAEIELRDDLAAGRSVMLALLGYACSNRVLTADVRCSMASFAT
jgi:hypothetical protein